MKVLIILSVLCLAVYAVPFGSELSEPVAFNGTKWVLLAAGGNTWSNYRHQSNVYHAYQIIKSHGIPDTNIVVMHYDDLANNKANPTPGIVINVPNGPDVYKGVPKDYTGADVNPLNFLAVLRGDPILARNHKKVIKSGPNDHIYVYFIDHGAPDLIAFPSQYLYGEELNAQFKQMYQDKKYAKLVINIEACNSGSMFEKLLPNDINVYTTTSANPQESSYAKDYDSKLKTYLGDYYSGAWLQVIEKEDLNVETLDQSYKYTVTSQNMSHPQQYGDLAIGKLHVAEFLGSKKDVNQKYTTSASSGEFVNSRNVPIALAEKLIESTEDINEKQRYVTELQRLLSGRQYMDKHFADFVNSIKHLIDTKNIDVLNGQESLNNRECYRKFVDTFNEKCFNINQNTYAFGKLQTFVNICENLIESSYVDNAVEHLVYHCTVNIESTNSEPIV